MLTQALQNRLASLATWLDGVGAPATARAGQDGVTLIKVIDEGVVIINGGEPLSRLISWSQVIKVEYAEAIPV